MNNHDEAWQQFLEDYEDFEDELPDDIYDEEVTTDKKYGLTLFNEEPNGYLIVFNTQIDIFQFVRLLRYFFGVNGIDVGHIDENGHHFHSIGSEDNDEDDDEE